MKPADIDKLCGVLWLVGHSTPFNLDPYGGCDSVECNILKLWALLDTKT